MQENVCGQTVEHHMMDVHKQVHCLGGLINDNAIEPVSKQVEGFHHLLEEVGLRFFVKLLQGDDGFLVIVTLLHHVTVGHHQAGLQVAVSLYRCLQGCHEALCVYLLKTVDKRYVVLRGVAVHFPIHVHAALIL